MDYPITTSTKDNNRIVIRNYYIHNITIPAGFKTNGANVPRIFWSIIPPFKPKYEPAYIVHDYLCNLERYKYADEKFKDILLEIEDSIITRAMVLAVTLYHRIKYGA